MKRVLRRFQTLPIRSRLAMLVAAAVAFGVAAVSVTCWFIVQGKLYEQVDNQLSNANIRLSQEDLTVLLTSCPKTATGSSGSMRPRDYYAQVVKADGTVCVFGDSAGVVKTTAQDQKMADDPEPGVRVFRNSTDTRGQDVRVRTTPSCWASAPMLRPIPASR